MFFSPETQFENMLSGSAVLDKLVDPGLRSYLRHILARTHDKWMQGSIHHDKWMHGSIHPSCQPNKDSRQFEDPIFG